LLSVAFLNDKYKHPPSTWTLKNKTRVCIGISFAASLLQQLFFMAAESQKVHHMMETCKWSENRTDFIEVFISYHLDHIFDLIPYHHAWGVPLEIGNFFIYFYWCFGEIFILLVSISISYRFQQINKRIAFFEGRIVSEETWNEVRLHYVMLCELLQFVDGRLDWIIVVVCLNNSYLILVQLLHIVA